MVPFYSSLLICFVLFVVIVFQLLLKLPQKPLEHISKPALGGFILGSVFLLVLFQFVLMMIGSAGSESLGARFMQMGVAYAVYVPALSAWCAGAARAYLFWRGRKAPGADDAARSRGVRAGAAVLFLAFTLLPLLPYAWTETLTLLHRNTISKRVRQLPQEEKIAWLGGRPVFHRVLSRGRDSAVVYVIFADGANPEPGAPHKLMSGNIIYYERRRGQWKLDRWYVRWSAPGNADDPTFPVY